MGRVIRDPEVDQGTQHLLKDLGAKVRAARAERGLSRREVSETSGVSPRYLAQLEVGEGNISVALLNRIARALSCDLGRFFRELDQTPASLNALFEAASPDTQSKIMALLEEEANRDARANRICLIGLRGAGKSTLGKRASERLGIPFVELNDEIAALGNMPVSEIMALYGPEGYRRLEAEALDKVIAQHDEMVLAVAGGIVEDPDTYASLLARCRTVWLQASPQEHMDRVLAQGDLRPMEGDPQAMRQLKAILTERIAHYARAELQIDTSAQTPESSLADLLDALAAPKS